MPFDEGQATDDNPFLKRLQDDPSLGRPSLWDRFSLNTLESKGNTITGAGTGAAMQGMLDSGFYGDADAKAAAFLLNKRHDDAVRYEAMPSWSGPLEGMVSLSGQMLGSMTSPEVLINRIPGLSRLFAPVAEKVLGRVAESAVSQGLVNAATDPIVQGLNIKSGQQKEFDAQQMALAFPLGAVVGGTLHGISEGVGAAASRWFGRPAEPGARVEVNDNDPATGPGPLHGEQGTIVGPAPTGEHFVVKMDGGDQVTVDPRILRNPDVPPVAEAVPAETGKPDFPKDGPAQSAEAVQSDKIRSELVSPDRPRTPDEVAAGLERDADPAAKAAPETPAAQPELQFRNRVAGSQPAAPPQGSTAGVNTDPVTSLHQQSMALADTLEMPLRQGRVQGGNNALGQFDVRQGVARTKVIADFDTVSHEAGHYLEQKVGKDLSRMIQANRAELGKMDYDAQRQDPAEGFAEFSRLYLTNPAAAQKLAPGFSQAFKPFMEQKAPDILKALDAAQAAHSAYVAAPSDVKLDAIVQRQDHGGVFATLKKEGIGRSVGMVLQHAYHALIDDKAPVARAVRDLARMARDASGTRLKLEGSDNPELLVRLFTRSHQTAVRDMLDGVRGYHQVAPSGPSLRDAIVTATGSKGLLGFWNDAKVKEFSNYLVARRGDVLYDKFDAGDLPNRPLALSRGDVQAAIAKAEKENPTFAAAASQVHDYTRQLLRKQFEGGLIDRETFDELKKERFYVPFYRDMSDKPTASGGPKSAKKSEGPGKTELIKKIRGSDRDIIDPVQSLMTQTFLVDRTIAHNDIVKSLVNLARKAQQAGAKGTGRILEEIPAHQIVGKRFDLAEAVQNAAREHGTDPLDTKVLLGSLADVFGDDPIMAPIFRREPTSPRGEPILFYKDGGQLKAVRLISDEEGRGLYEALASLPQHANDIAVHIGSLFATAKRAGITSNPVFALTNFFRDQLAAMIIRPDYIPVDPRGIVKELRQSEAAQLYTFAGGVSPGAGAAGLSEMVRGDIDALARKRWDVQKLGGISDLVRHGDVLSGMKAVSETIGVAESGTRLNVMEQVFRQKKAQGLNDYDAMMEAAWQATDLMDFGRHGSRTMSLRALIPFLNASVVSLDKANRTLIQPLLRGMRGDLVTASEVAEFKNAGLAWFKMAGVGGALGYMYGMMMADHDAYRDANDQLRATHLIIPGGTIGQPGKILVVPKPFELAIGFNLGEMLGLQVATGDPRTAGFAMDGVMEVLTPPSILSDIPVVSTYAELKLNRSFFTGRDIVPERLQGLEPGQQFNDKTSSFGRWLGGVLGVSPMKVDYSVGSSFGLWGRDLLAATTAADSNAPDPATEDTMFLRRFIKNADISSETTKAFWNVAGSQDGEFATAKQTYESFLNQYQDEAASQYLATLPAEKRAFVTLQSAADDDGKPAFTADEKRLNPIYRAATAVQTINGYIRDLQVNTQRTSADNQRMDMDPNTRRKLIDNLRILGAMEQRNALVMTGEPGYTDRPLLSPEDQFDVIMAISPAAGVELATRYATAKIYKTDVVAKAWPQAKQALIHDGSLADVGDLATNAKLDGYAFDGDRATKAGKRRVVIPGAP
jgi:hypothetical protein